jgi:hypothetical protein
MDMLYNDKHITWQSTIIIGEKSVNYTLS